MKTLLHNWTWMRWLRLIMGLAVVVQSILNRDWIFVLFGGLLALTALMNIGCCGSSGCNINGNKMEKNKHISYEKLDHTK